MNIRDFADCAESGEFEMVEDASKALAENEGDQKNEIARDNRYPTLPLSARNRIIIQDSPYPADYGYLHANKIKPILKGCNTSFIAMQAPTCETTDGFWEVVWEQKCALIVMLTRVEESVVKVRTMSYEYWPSNGDALKIKTGLKVSLTDEQIIRNSDGEEYLVERTFTLKKSKEKKRVVTHLQFLSWIDGFIPDLSVYNDFLSVYRQRKRFTANEYKRSPIVVHCSAGIGRTGVFVVLETLMEHCAFMMSQDNENGPIVPCIDVPRTLFELRKQRLGLVNNRSQYSFVYEFLNYAIENSRHGMGIPDDEDCELSYDVQFEMVSTNSRSFTNMQPPASVRSSNKMMFLAVMNE